MGPLNHVQSDILETRILARDPDGNVTETPDGLVQRVAGTLASSDTEYSDFSSVLNGLQFIPNSPCLVNAGRPLGQLAACFVLPIEDSIQGIMHAATRAALIHQTGGGTGFDFSGIREGGSRVKSTGNVASGPSSFLDIFDTTTGAIKQGGVRRGANMGILRIDHPDILSFIAAKRYNCAVCGGVRGPSHGGHDFEPAPRRWENFNVSVAITDRFLEALASGSKYALVSPRNGTTTDYLDARTVWNTIAEAAWDTGDPGLFFVDRVNAASTVPGLGRIAATNPCVTGDTKVHTVYEGPVDFETLANRGTDTLVYAWHPETKLPVVRWMRNPRQTRKNAEIIEVEFDSGLKVRCTPDHSFHTFRGKKTKARDLSVGQSVRAFSVSQHRDGHLRAHGWKDNRTQHQWVARMIWENENGTVPKNSVVHHRDHNPTNNEPENLMLASKISHNIHHYPDRLQNGFYYNESREAALARNHKIVAIRPAGYADVYNGTVDDAHTYIIADNEPIAGILSGIVSANCGEVPLLPDETCNLGSINLAKFAAGPSWNLRGLERTTRIAVRFLNRVIDVNKYPDHAIEKVTRSTRKIGLGVMGWADSLIMRGIRYDSEEAYNEAEYIMSFIQKVADDESSRMGEFPAFKDSNFTLDHKRRNSSVTVIAPTGTIARIADCSSGIEPLFATSYTSHIMDKEIKYDHPLFGLYDKSLFRLASQISPEDHLRMQAAFQRHVDDSISKTVNLPEHATPDDVLRVYNAAVEMEVKGVTVFRDGCLFGRQVLSTTSEALCPVCSKELIHQEGCEECECGYSACSV